MGVNGVDRGGRLRGMRRSIDDQPMTADELPPGADDAMAISWAVAISDDYDDGEPRIDRTRRLRQALHDALREIGEAPGD